MLWAFRLSLSMFVFFSFTVISYFYKIFLTFQIFNNNFKCAVDLLSFFAVILLVAQTSICITLLAVPARVMREGLVTDISVIENRTAVISCPVSGIPQPSIIWFRGESVYILFISSCLCGWLVWKYRQIFLFVNLTVFMSCLLQLGGDKSMKWLRFLNGKLLRKRNHFKDW